MLVVDALDEAGTPPNQNVLGLPQILPEGVYLIVSQRPVPVTLQVDSASTPRRVFHLAADSTDNQVDMHRFLEDAAIWPGVARALRGSGVVTEQFIATLLEKCRGVWIYLHYVLHEIDRGERSPLNLAALPDGMTQYYARYWQRWRDADQVQWYETYLPLLATLAAAQEAVPVGRLAEWSGVQATAGILCRLVDESWRPYLTVDSTARDRTPMPTESVAEVRSYRLYHASLREFLNAFIDATRLSESERVFVRELAQATVKAHVRVANYYYADPSRWRIHNMYALRHLSTHLRAAGEDTRLYDLVTSKEWWTAKRQHDPSGRAYSRDVEFALEMVEEVIRGAVHDDRWHDDREKAEGVLGCLPALLALTLASSLVRGMGSNAPIEAIAGLAEFGEVGLALDHAAFIMDARDYIGATTFPREVLRSFDSVLECSTQAEAYRRIALVCLSKVDTCQYSGDQELCQEWLRQARFALSCAVRILEDKHAESSWRALLPAMIRAGMTGEVERITRTLSPEQAADSTRDRSQESDNALDLRWFSETWVSGRDTQALLTNLYLVLGDVERDEDALTLVTQIPVAVRAIKSAGWFGGDLSLELSLVASQIARLGNRTIATEFIEAVKTLSFEYDDQKGRTLAGVVEMLTSQLLRERTAELLDESWRIVSANDRLDFRTVGQARVIMAMHRVGLQTRARELLTESIKATKDIWPLYDREFALGGPCPDGDQERRSAESGPCPVSGGRDGASDLEERTNEASHR